MEYKELVECHPLLVLIKKQPHVWYGLINVNNYKNIEIKIKVPKYPSMQDTTVKFGSGNPFKYDTNFMHSVTKLTKTSKSLLIFLENLQKLMEKFIKENTEKVHEYNWIENIMEELNEAFEVPFLKVFVKDDLDPVKLTYRGISIILTRNEKNNSSWKLVSSDLPKHSAWENLECCISTLKNAAITLAKRTDSVIDALEDFQEIDDKCHILDPIHPKTSHLHRRIYVNPSLSILINVDPLNPRNEPTIKILGSASEIQKYDNLYESNHHKWLDDRSILYNLSEIFEMDEWPEPRNYDDSDVVSSGIYDDKSACCICFEVELKDENSPSEVCSNQKCQKYFHRFCLVQWLQSVPDNKNFLGTIYGICPNCSENISCAINT